MKQTNLLDSFLKKSVNQSQTMLNSPFKQQINDKEEQFQLGDNNTSKNITQNDNKNLEIFNLQLNQNTNLFDRSKFTDSTPQWAIPNHPQCKDKYCQTSKDPNYDQTTLKVPDSAWSTFTAPLKQYWKIKSQNFDKIIFFKLGKFYQLFYQDALVCNQLLNLKWMGTKMHVGFPQKSLNRYTQQLVKRGLKVVVVQQMQTPEEMNNRIQEDKKIGRKSQKTLKRQITQIISKGTIQSNQNDVSYLPNYLISVYKKDNLIAYSLLDINSNLILLGVVQNYEQFKTILYQTFPSQFLFDPDNIPSQYIQKMKENIQGLVFTKLINKNNIWHYMNTNNQFQLQKQRGYQIPKIFQQLQKLKAVQKNLILSTLAGIFNYLHKIFKFQYVISTAKFKFYEKNKSLTHMILDSQALQHLQIFQTTIGPSDSLFSKIDRTKTLFGKRLFRRWITSPLLSEVLINQRLDSVSDFRNLGSLVDQIQKILIKLPDLQKITNKLYKYSIKNTSAASAVYFEDLNTHRLKQFEIFMKSIQDSFQIIAFLNDHFNQLKSQRLIKLISTNKNHEQLNEDKFIFYQDEQIDKNSNCFTEIKGMLPNILEQLQIFKKYIVWKDGKPFPKPGVILLYDNLLKKQIEIKNLLQVKLQKLRQQMGCPQINYVHIKQRYEVQIPEKKNIKISKQYSFSSRKAGYSRYLVPQVQQMVQQLQIIQKGLKTQMSIFVSFFFEQFRIKQNIWQRYISIIAQIDCLAGMSQFSKQRKTCRPIFTENGYEVMEGVHPSLYSGDFVPNDISFSYPIIILTGPNMGGKSTILRTSCLLAIMAQIGSYVPCKSYKAAIIDRIFTRIGASDKLQAGKSTFFIQMEQTKSILKNATNRSLAIIDQLGRGTATYDGMALAHSVLNFMINQIKCKCMFATHYHSLTQQFSHVQGTCLNMMDYQITEQKQGRIKFLYQLVNGKAQKSFGLNVAQLVGLPKALINYAKLKSNQMHQLIQLKKKQIKTYQAIQISNKIFAKI